jgi:arginine deiminase
MEASVATERRVRVASEIGALRAVVCHTPGPELLAVTPSTKEDFLYDDIIDLDAARREHQRFKAILTRFSEVHELRDLLADVLELPEGRRFLIERVMDVTQSGPLGRAMEGLSSAELVKLFIEGRPMEEGHLARLLNVDSYDVPPLPNLFFTRDAGMVVGGGVIIGAMRYTVRWTEEILMKALFAFHPLLRNDGFIYDGSEERRSGYTIEGGDVHVLRPDTVIMGLSQRSSPGAFDAITSVLARNHGIEHVIVVVLPSDRAMIHLDMVFTMVDREHAVVFPPAFVGPDRYAVLYYRAGADGGMREMPNVFTALREVDLSLEPIFCGGERRTFQEREQW